MNTSLRQAAQDYIEMRRALGFKLREVGKRLLDFVNFLEEVGAEIITIRLAVAWAKQNPEATPQLWSARLSAVRQFARYFSAIDPRTEVPPQGILSNHYVRRNPHIYTVTEVRRLIREAWRLRPQNGVRPEDALWRWTVATFIGLLSVTGLRMSEARKLKRDDVDFEQALLVVHRTKFDKTRLVPLHESTLRALRRYVKVRDRIHPVPRTPYFFVGQTGAALDDSYIELTFAKLSRKIGLRRPTGRYGPRLHDLRHTLAVNTVVGWYEAGVDVQSRMPVLSTFLGHAHVSDTYWYLSATPRLLALAAERLEKPSSEVKP
jgi:integrase/recombinase XerD